MQMSSKVLYLQKAGDIWLAKAQKRQFSTSVCQWAVRAHGIEKKDDAVKLDRSKAEESGGEGRRISERQQIAAARKQSQGV